eukprot:scaffold1050_cov211-Skeletonema_marinoi.AAC.1
MKRGLWTFDIEESINITHNNLYLNLKSHQVQVSAHQLYDARTHRYYLTLIQTQTLLSNQRRRRIRLCDLAMQPLDTLGNNSWQLGTDYSTSSNCAPSFHEAEGTQCCSRGQSS